MSKREPDHGVTGDKAQINPWIPITDPRALKFLGKLGEEAGELSSAVSRCIIQGLDEAEPVTGKVNREWLEDEIADMYANLKLVTEEFDLDVNRIMARAVAKRSRLKVWHDLIPASEATPQARPGAGDVSPPDRADAREDQQS